MVLENRVYAAQMRLMQHYVNVARNAYDISLHGGDNSVHALSIMEAEWPQIERCWEWLTEHATESDEIAALLVTMASNVGYVLRGRLPFSDALIRNQHALAAAERLGDSRAAASRLVSIGVAFLMIGQLDRASETLIQASVLAEQHGHWKELASALHNLATIKEDKGELEEAVALIERALDCYRRIDDIPSIGRALSSLASIVSHQGQWEKAERYIQESYTNIMRSGDYEDIARVLQQLGQLHRYLGRYAEARTAQIQALEFLRRIGDQRRALLIMMDLAVSYDNEGQFAEAQTMYLQALGLARYLGQGRAEAVLFGNLGYSAYLQENFADSIYYTKQSLALLRDQKALYMLCIGLANIIPAYLPLGEIDQARRALHEGLELAVSLGADLLKSAMVVATVQTWVASSRVDDDPNQQNTLLSSAAQWSGLIHAYPGAEQENREEINKLLPGLVSELGAERTDDLMQQGAQLNIDEVIAGILASLDAFAD